MPKLLISCRKFKQEVKDFLGSPHNLSHSYSHPNAYDLLKKEQEKEIEITYVSDKILSIKLNF